MLTTLQVLSIVHAIYITEGGEYTKHPYGIIPHYEHTTPRQACINTVQHYITSHPSEVLSRSLVEHLAAKYCPSSVDPIGHKNWIKNMETILHL
jgi:hypothetical protein